MLWCVQNFYILTNHQYISLGSLSNISSSHRRAVALSLRFSKLHSSTVQFPYLPSPQRG